MDVTVEAFPRGFKPHTLHAADEADRVHVRLLRRLGAAELGEGVDDDSEDDVEQHDQHDYEEGEVVRPDVQVAVPLGMRRGAWHGHDRSNVAGGECIHYLEPAVPRRRAEL